MADRKRKKQRSPKENSQLRDDFEATIDVFKRANLGLQSSNEDMQAVNDELQAANEEMTASKDALLSLIEERDTANKHLMVKIKELEESRNDVNNFFSSTNIPALFLDRQFNVRRFTPALAGLAGVLSSDIGRPLARMLQNQLGTGLLADALTVFNCGASVSREILLEEASYERTTQPYRVANDCIEGVVITFIDITMRGKTEELTGHNDGRFHVAGKKVGVDAETLHAKEISGHWLKGEGEMARRIREFDWSGTPIGPMEHWPQSLKTATSLCIASRFQLIIFWTRDLIQIYNDAFLTILGNKHPCSLGQTAKESWAEMWDDIRPLYEYVFKTGTATWTEHIRLPVVRHGYLEESLYTMSYTPIFLEDGSVGGVFNVVIETTHQVVAERRTKILKDLAAKTAELQTVEGACKTAIEVLAASADIPFVSAYLLEPDGTILKLAGVANAEPGGPVAPNEINIYSAGGWPVAEAVRSLKTQIVNDVQSRFGHIKGGPWGYPVQTALVLPLIRHGREMPYGVLIAGATPQRALDDDFKDFFALVAHQVTTAVGNVHAYEEERARAESLAELDRAKTAFFNNVSHEFRTPLTLMLGPLEELLLRSHTDLAPAARDQLEVVNRNGLRLLRLVNTLLDFSRIEAGHVHAVFMPTDLAAYTAELAGVFRAATERAGLNLIVDCPKLTEPVYVDRDMWEKIVLNLVSNAFKFTFDGEIEVKLRAESSNAVLIVRDTGVGIAAEEMPRLFERFHRVQNVRSRTHEGSGIGLALVQELVKLHGGNIRAESRIGEGTTFIVTVSFGSNHLPPDHIGETRNQASTAIGAVAYVEEALRWLPEILSAEKPFQTELCREPVPTPCPAGTADEKADRPRILIADDNADMRHHLSRMLSERYHVEAVPDGRAALESARARRPDLIISDVMMPNLDGFGLVRELREDSALKTISIILLSARAGEESRLEGLQQGADDYLIKPFSARELMARVAAHLEIARIRKQAAEELHKKDERFQRYFELGIVGMAIASPGKGILEVNDRICEILCYDRDELMQMNWAELTHPDDLAADIAQFNRVLSGEIDGYSLDKRFIRKDGKLVYSTISVKCLRLPDGSVDNFVALVQDITERKLAEDALQESEERFRLIAEKISIGIAITRLSDSRIVFANPAYHETLGFRPGELIGQFAPDLYCDPADREKLILTLKERGFLKDYAIKLKKPDGAAIWVSSTLQFIEYNGEPVLMSSSIDITEHKQADESLQRHAAELTAANHNLEDFAHSITHDLRNPLNAILSNSEVLKECIPPEEKDGQTALGYIYSSTKRMAGIINDLMSLMKVTSQEVNLKQCDLSDMAKAVVEELKILEPARVIDCLIEPGAIAVADDGLVWILMQNLLNNAWKFTSNKAVARIEFGTKSNDGDSFFYVRDNGVGFDMSKADRLFKPYQRLHSKKEYPGTGIGLTIVKRVIEKHGGEIWVEAEEDKGAAFYFTLNGGGQISCLPCRPKAE